MGVFFEVLTAGFFGGKMVDSLIRLRNLPLGEAIPDIECRKNNFLMESKACRLGHQLNLLDSQVEGYKNKQMLDPSLRIFYVLWRHSFPKIKSFKGTDGRLFSELAVSTKALLVLPFSIVLALYKPSRGAAIELNLKRYETDKWDYCTRIGSGTINHLLYSPLEVLFSLGLNVKNYKWSWYMSPSSFFVNDFKMVRFPMVFIEDVNTKAWVSNMIKEEGVPF